MADFLGSLGSLFTGSGMQEAERARQAELEQGYQRYLQASGQGREAATTQYNLAADPYKQLQGVGNQGYQAYADASGANGPEGLARAQATYTGSQPGWANTLQSIADITARSGAAGGQATGNTLAGITDRVTQKGLEGWGDYVGRLAPWLGQNQQTAAGLSGTYRGLGDVLNANYLGQAGAGQKLGEQMGQSRYAEEFAPTMGAQNLVNLGMQGLTALTNFAAPGASSLMKPQLPGSGSYPKLFG